MNGCPPLLLLSWRQDRFSDLANLSRGSTIGRRDDCQSTISKERTLKQRHTRVRIYASCLRKNLLITLTMSWSFSPLYCLSLRLKSISSVLHTHILAMYYIPQGGFRPFCVAEFDHVGVEIISCLPHPPSVVFN